MTAKEYLTQIRRTDISIRQKEEELARLESEITSLGSLDYSKERVQTSPTGDPPYVSAIARVTALEGEIRSDIARFAEQRGRMINQIQSLDNPDYVALLYKHYVEYKTLDRIADEMHFDYDYIRHMHGWALQTFGERYLSP